MKLFGHCQKISAANIPLAGRVYRKRRHIAGAPEILLIGKIALTMISLSKDVRPPMTSGGVDSAYQKIILGRVGVATRFYDNPAATSNPAAAPA